MEIHIGKKIKALVKEHNLSTEDAAKILGVSVSSVYKIYNRPTIDIDKLIKASQYFKVNLFKYYMETEPLKSIFDQEFSTLNNEISRLKELQVQMQDHINTQKEYIDDLKKNNC